MRKVALFASMVVFLAGGYSIVRTAKATKPFNMCGIPTASQRQAEDSTTCDAAPFSHCVNCTWSDWTHYWKITWGDSSTTNVDAFAQGDCTIPTTISCNTDNGDSYEHG
jgi:hypothetical protein